MKTRSRYVFSAAVAGVALSGIPSMLHLDAAHGATVAQFTFESLGTASTTATNFGTYTADAGVNAGSAFAMGFHSVTTTSAASASNWNSVSGNGSVHSLSVNRWNVGDYFEFDVNTTNFQDLIVSFDTTGSGTSPKNFTFYYSSDGTNFTSVGTYSLLTTPGWSSAATASNALFNQSFNLTAITALNGDANAKFRIVDSETAATSSAGTVRVDNFLVVANPAAVPEPASVSLMTVAAASTLLRRRRNA